MMTFDLFQTSQFRFERLRGEWPSAPFIDWRQVEERYLALSPEDQDHCSRLAARYLSSCRRTGSIVASPIQWIEARGWVGFLERDRRTAKAFEAKRTPVWVVEGTPAWEAWKRHRERQGRRMPSPESIRTERGAGWWFPAAFPSDAKAKRSKQARNES